MKNAFKSPASANANALRLLIPKAVWEVKCVGPHTSVIHTTHLEREGLTAGQVSAECLWDVPEKGRNRFMVRDSELGVRMVSSTRRRQPGSLSNGEKGLTPSVHLSGCTHGCGGGGVAASLQMQGPVKVAHMSHGKARSVYREKCFP